MTLRILIPLPVGLGQEPYFRWGDSLGYALHIGL